MGQRKIRQGNDKDFFIKGEQYKWVFKELLKDKDIKKWADV